MKRPELAATAPFALAFFLTACGGVSGIDDLFQDSSGAGGSTTTTAGQGGATGGTTGGVGGASTSVSSSSGLTTTSTTTGQGTTSTGSTGSGSTATASGSSSSGGPTSTVYCNNAPCAAGEICCFSSQQPNDKCGQPNSCGDGYIELECNGPEDCPGGVCCADVDFQSNQPYKNISCKQSCNNPSQNIIVCNDANPACPFGTKCEASQYLGQGYKVCK